MVTRDVPGLFSLIAGTLAAHGINIMSAQIDTRADGIAIDTFQVNDPTGEAVTSAAHWRRTLDALRAVLRARPRWTSCWSAAGSGRRQTEACGPAQDHGRQPRSPTPTR